MAESDVYCNVGMNLDEVNFSERTLFTLTFYKSSHILYLMMGKAWSSPFPKQKVQWSIFSRLNLALQSHHLFN